MAESIPGNDLGTVGTDGDHLNPALIELCSQFLESAQLADTVGSPVPAEELDQHQLAGEGRRIEGVALTVGGGKRGDSIAHLNDPTGVHDLFADGDGEGQEAADQDPEHGRHGTEETDASKERNHAQDNGGQERGDEQGPIFRQIHLPDQIEPVCGHPDSEQQGDQAQFCTRFHEGTCRQNPGPAYPWRRFRPSRLYRSPTDRTTTPMDPISQAALGASCAQTTQRTHLGWLSLFGIVAGMAPDLDVFIQSSTDPLLFLEYHRQFTHSLVFMPVGALLVTLLLYRLPRQPLSFRVAYLAALAGYASHAPLDACTSYGTQLFWPFTDDRISWNTVSVVDPLFTLPLVVLAAASVWSRRRSLAAVGLCWALLYLAAGYGQWRRVTEAAVALAESRGHVPARLLVKPAFGTQLLWKSIYQHDGRYYVDGHRAAFTVAGCGGDSAAVLNLARDFPWLKREDQQARDVERFRWFSTDYLALHQTSTETLVIDVRYAMLPNEIDPLWGIALDPVAPVDAHVGWRTSRSPTERQRSTFAALLTGEACNA